MHLKITFSGAVERPASMTKLDTFQVYKDDSIHSQYIILEDSRTEIILSSQWIQNTLSTMLENPLMTESLRKLKN